MNNDSLVNQIKELIAPLAEGLKRLEVKFTELEQGQKRLEKNYLTLQERQKRLEQIQEKQGRDLFMLREDIGELKFMRLDIKQLQMDNRSTHAMLSVLELDNKELKENTKLIDLKVEAFNKKLDLNKDEILSFMQYLYQNSVTHDQLAKVDARVKILEKNL